MCSDMWQPYLKVIAAKAGQALHVLDRFHITMHLNQALDQVRRAESGRLRAAGRAQAEHLKNMRWKLLRRGSRVRGKARCQLGPAAAHQAGHRAGLGAQGTSLNTSGRYKSVELGRRLSGLLDLAGLAQPHGADEKGRPHAAHA